MFELNRPFYLHSDKKHKHPLTIQEFTIEELKSLSGHCYFITRFGDLAQAKITSVKTWVTRPNNVDIHLKHGLYEYFIASWVNGESTGEQLVKIVDTESSQA